MAGVVSDEYAVLSLPDGDAGGVFGGGAKCWSLHLGHHGVGWQRRWWE